MFLLYYTIYQNVVEEDENKLLEEVLMSDWNVAGVFFRLKV